MRSPREGLLSLGVDIAVIVAHRGADVSGARAIGTEFLQMGAICWGLEANVSRETYGDQNAKAILVQGKGKRSHFCSGEGKVNW
jgi:hypothetical protein